MVTCMYCSKPFKNAQALRAHLGHCTPRRVQQGAEPIGSRPGSQAAYRQPGSLKAGGVAEPVLDELQAERAKLDLRKVKAEHRRLDGEEQERAGCEEAAREQARLERQAEREAEERAERETRREARRRELIQDAKKRAESSWARGRAIPSPVKAQALRAVEEELASLARLEALPAQEIRELAQGAWDGVVLPWVQTLEAQEERERQRRREAEEAKQRLVARGKRHAEDRLDAEGVQGLDRFGITLGVSPALDREIEGTESTQDVEELVEGLLAPEIKRVRRQAEERRRQEEERERQRQEQEEKRQRQQAEWARQQRERQEQAIEARLAANRQRLASHGQYHALRILNEENELKPSERFQVAGEVKEQLLDELDGDESQEEVEDLVEEILGEELD